MKIKINNYDWNIKLVPKKEIDGDLGLCHYADLTIKIGKEQDKQLIKDTILHEIIHAFIFSYGFDKNSYTNEEITCFFTQNIPNIIKIRDDAIKEMKI